MYDIKPVSSMLLVCGGMVWWLGYGDMHGLVDQDRTYALFDLFDSFESAVSTLKLSLASLLRARRSSSTKNKLST